MGEPIVTLRARRLWNFTIAGLVALSLIAMVLLEDISLRDSRFLTGWMLVAGMLFLTIYNSRKKLPFVPLLRSALWLQAHAYVGLLVALVFLLHTSLRFPAGVIETTIWVLFVVMILSGLLGMGLSRALPGRLSAHGERMIFERIPLFRAELAKEVEELVRRSVVETRSSVISDYYASRLHDFFRRPRNLLPHLVQSRRPMRALDREIVALRRYLDKGGREILAEIEARVIAKNNLDFQYASQLVLKLWLFVHIPLTYSLLVLAAVHMVLVYAFSSSTL